MTEEMHEENVELVTEEEQQVPPAAAPEEEETITITLKRSTFFAILIPIAFLVGLGSGYFVWGRGGGGAVSTTDSAGVESANGPLPRYDIPIDDDDPALGPEDAPITVVEFSDFECPFCRRHTLETAPVILAQYEGQVRYVFKDFPLTSIHPNAFAAAEAAHCAREQDAFWEYHDLLFELELPLGPTTYLQHAEDIGLNMEQFTQCVDERKYAETVQADFDFAAQLGVRSTPTFFINGIAVVGAQPFTTFQEVIEGELNGTNN